MSLKLLIGRLKNRGYVTPVTPEKNTRLQPKPSIHAACTPVTPVTSCFINAREIVQKGESGMTMTPEAQIVEYRLYSKLQPPPPTPETTQSVEPLSNPLDWHELDAAYQAHHFNCKTCIAAGRGVQYGLRCGTGAALWRAYSDASTPT